MTSHAKAGDFAPASHPFLSTPKKSFPQDQYGVSMRKNPADCGADHISSSRKAFANLLWRAFPSPSEHDLSHRAAHVLDVSPRQVKNWLRCEHSAAWHYVAAVMAIAGCELVFRERGE